jgi:hypothetical protein
MPKKGDPDNVYRNPSGVLVFMEPEMSLSSTANLQPLLPAGFTRSLFATAVALMCAPGAAAAFPATAESLSWKPSGFVLVAREKTGWKGIRGDETTRGIYAPPGATSANWTVKAEVTNLPIAITLTGKFHWNPESVMNRERAVTEKQHCSTDGWRMLEKDESSILWEWKDIKCPEYLHQYEIVRVVMGRWYLWILSYGLRNRELSADERAELIRDLQSATIVKGGVEH